MLIEIQLVARPLVDDNAIFGYLHNRYQVSLAHKAKWAYADEIRVMYNLRLLT